jgi:DNA-binding LacI/PurR family transcriptional regulator
MKTNSRRVTRKDVAKLANVSESMVSYVINGYKYVSEEKSKRVKKAIKELNYKPNAIARSLKTNKTNHIIFIVDQLSNENFGYMIKYMEKHIYNKEYLITLCSARNGDKFTSLINSRQFDGIIISSYILNDETIKSLASHGVPIIIFENRICNIKKNNILKIDTGLYKGTKLGIEYLIKKKNRKNIVFIDKLQKNSNDNNHIDLKIKAYKDTLKDHNIELGNEYLITGCKTNEEIEKKLTSLINSGLKVDAIFGRNDYYAILGMNLLQDLGYSIPEQVSVIGFDNSSIGELVKPNLTSIMVRREKIAKMAISALCNMIDGKKAEYTLYEPKLIERSSV